MQEEESIKQIEKDLKRELCVCQGKGTFSKRWIKVNGHTKACTAITKHFEKLRAREKRFVEEFNKLIRALLEEKL